MNNQTLTFKLIGDGPMFEASCKGIGQSDRLTINASGVERIYDPEGSEESVAILRFSDIRVSNIFGFVVQKIQQTTPSKDVDIELPANIANMILDLHKRNPDKKHKITFAPKSGGLF